jgi:hypothetical protein
LRAVDLTRTHKHDQQGTSARFIGQEAHVQLVKCFANVVSHNRGLPHRRLLSFLCVSHNLLLWLEPHSTCISISSPTLKGIALTPSEAWPIERGAKTYLDRRNQVLVDGAVAMHDGGQNERGTCTFQRLEHGICVDVEGHQAVGWSVPSNNILDTHQVPGLEEDAVEL